MVRSPRPSTQPHPDTPTSPAAPPSFPYLSLSPPTSPTALRARAARVMVPPAADVDAPTVEDLELDETKLVASAAAERGDLFLLNWLSAAEKAVELLPEVSRFGAFYEGLRVDGAWRSSARR